MRDHDDSQFDYAWVIPRWRWLHAFYHYTERHQWPYSLTKPIWWARYHWRVRQIGTRGY
jgi:hypothetical protein